MRKLILQEFLSLDGLAADSAGSVDFVPASVAGDQSLGQHQLDFIDSVDTILLGRVTWEMFSQYWPNVTTGEDKLFAEKINATPKVVFSQTLQHAPWGDFPPARIVGSEAATEVADLKAASGKNMVLWGSLSVAESLMRENLIDVYHLFICPVVLGGGRPLFRAPLTASDLILEATRAFDRGAAFLTYSAAPL